MKKLLTLAIIALVSLPVMAGSLTGTGSVDSYTFQAKSYSSSQTRQYKVYKPSSYDGSQAYPMIMALHGCGMDHNDVLNDWNLDLIADNNGVIVVYPFITSYDGMRNTNCWGYWFTNHQVRGQGEPADLYNIGLEVEANYNIDENRRYIIGLSSGAGMSVIMGVVYRDYFAAAVHAAGLAYGDGSTSVTSEIFNSATFHKDKIQAVIGSDTKKVPMLLIHNTSDEVVRITGSQLIRDSQLTAYGFDTQADGSSEDCSYDGKSCTKLTYNDSDGNPYVVTAFYNGQVSGTQCGSLGCGHYWVGDDLGNWSYDVGPIGSEMSWNFLSQYTNDGFGGGACDDDTTAPATPTGLTVGTVSDKTVTLTINANTEEDLKGYNIYSGATKIGFASSTSITVSGLSPETAYTVTAKAVDNCGNESGSSNSVSFTTLELQYVAPTATGTCTTHYMANRLDVSGYIACGTEYGYMASVTMWQYPDGSWTFEDLNDGGGQQGDTTPPATPAGLQVTGKTYYSVNLSWTANEENDLAGYKVYKATSASGNYSFAVNASSNSATIPGLSASTTYYFKVSAIDTSNNESAQSTAVSETTEDNQQTDTTPPVITLLGSSSVTITVGDSYTDAGATAQDNVDGDITANIVVTGSVNTSVAGTYTLSYNVSDAANNAATQVQRTVVVQPAASQCFTATNSAHKNAGRAILQYVNLYYAVGSNEYLGLSYMTTSLQQNGSSWNKVTSCP